MLGKLIKHEFKATSREFFMLYLALLALTVLNKLFLVLNDSSGTLFNSGSLFDRIMTIVQGLLMLAYVFLCMAVFIITIVLILMRFYKNMTGDEGYLMFTLPVPTWTLIVSKAVTAFIWEVLSCFAFLVSMIILFWGCGFFPEFKKILAEMDQIFEFIPVSTFMLFCVLMLLMVIVTAFYSLITFYFCIAVGHLAKKHRIAVAVGTYFLYNFVMQFISFFAMLHMNLFLQKQLEHLNELSMHQPLVFARELLSTFNGYSSVALVFIIVITGAVFFATTRIFSKNLNLE